MKSGLALRKVIQTVAINTASTNLTTSAWLTLIASLTYGASSCEIVNPSGSSIQIALGAAGSEVAIPYTVPAGGTSPTLAIELPKGSRLSAKAIDTTVSSGYFIVNLFA